MAKSKSYVTIADRMLIDEIAKEAQKVLELAKKKRNQGLSLYLRRRQR